MKIFINKSDRGFTLLEITATLMIIVIISGLAGFSIVNYVDAYTLHKQHAEIAQQARLVINRLVNEFVHITAMRSASEDEIVFCSRFNNLKDTTISFQDNCLKINNEIFADNISNFKLRYLSGVKVFDNVESHQVWIDNWKDEESTAIQFDISFNINPVLLKDQRTYSINFTNITTVPRSLGAIE
jgi:prepilin-type N-terminal cleavage/methylation domain-containing protein